MNQPTKESFLKDVETHEMKILKDDGLYRHLRFQRTNTSNMYFDIITFPDGLLYRGDMGTYEFERIEDMFEFFRNPNSELGTNKVYWAEKVQSIERNGGLKEFNFDMFKKNVESYLKNFSNDPEIMEAVREEVEEQILDREENEYVLYDAVYNFESDHGLEFPDFFECRSDSFTYRYVWCCYAIAWAVIQYDKDNS